VEAVSDILDDLARYEGRPRERRIVLIGRCIGSTPASASVSLVQRVEMLARSDWRGVLKATANRG